MNAVATPQLSPALSSLQTAFAAHGSEPAALVAVREQAITRFMTQGFPGIRDEDWKYTALRRLEATSFAAAATTAPATGQRLPALPEAQDVYRLVFVDGRFDAAASNVPQAPGVSVRSLNSALHTSEGAAALQLGLNSASRFIALNAALSNDGALIELAANARLEQPLCLLFIATMSATAQMTHPRVVIRLGQHAELDVIEHYLGNDNQPGFTNAVTWVELATGARLQHERLQNESGAAFHIGALHATLAQDAAFTSRVFNMGGQLSRLDVLVMLQGKGAEVVLEGLQFANGQQHHDTHTRVEHAVPHTRSSEDYRGIADQRGRVVFNGKVLVHEHARGTDAQQSSRNLLLSRHAEIDTKPELEIYNDDVKCAHGATVGQLDATAIFYLRSRGLDESQARALLTHAFADQLIGRMSVAALREQISQDVHARFDAKVDAE